MLRPRLSLPKGLIIVDFADPAHFKPTDWFEVQVSTEPYPFLSGDGVKRWGFLTQLRNRPYLLRVGDPERLAKIRAQPTLISPIDQQEWDQMEAGLCPVVKVSDVAKAVLALPGSSYWDLDWYKKR